jgi:hypothetical protein
VISILYLWQPNLKKVMLGTPVSYVMDSDNFFNRPAWQFLTPIRRGDLLDGSEPVTNPLRLLRDHMPRKIPLSTIPLLTTRRNTLFLKKATVRNWTLIEQAGLGQLMMA